jgi:hypothetical protein
MSTEAPHNTQEPGRVLPFTPRKAPKSHAFSNLSRQSLPNAASAVRDLSKFSQPASEPDDFSHRMKMNALVGVVLLVLIGGGLWIVDVMTQMRKNQDCALSGRRNCTPISLPESAR